MNHITYPIIFENAFDENFCNKILNTDKNLEFKKGKISYEDSVSLDVRHSNVKFIEGEWLYKALDPFFQEANKKGNWNFQFDWYEPAQITNYNKNNFYNWHSDDFEKPYPSDNSNINFHNKIRKLSCSLLLSNKFKGGSLDFVKTFSIDGKISLQKVNVQLHNIGDLIIFPSFIHHKVNPITEGVRNSLVVWALGKPYD